jgi:hypothetical protein
MRTLLVVLILLAECLPAKAQCVDVKYRPGGCVDLKPFACHDTARSSFVGNVCYDKRNSYMLIKLQSTWYHYCGISEPTVTALASAGSIGRYYNSYVKGNFDCRVNPVPTY